MNMQDHAVRCLNKSIIAAIRCALRDREDMVAPVRDITLLPTGHKRTHRRRKMMCEVMKHFNTRR